MKKNVVVLRNTQRFPKKIVNEAIKEVQEKIDLHCLFGYLHTNDFNDMSKVAFGINKFYWYKGQLKAEIEILNTYCGRILKQVLKPHSDKISFLLFSSGFTDINDVVTEMHILGSYCAITPYFPDKAERVLKSVTEETFKQYEPYYSELKRRTNK